ncbi:hypothetical protein KY362_00395, partial [Candidatus Woesearchaeota archaeon]|nr:hypothetical protein [Candidatus Woesearchaeota archaeon]
TLNCTHLSFPDDTSDSGTVNVGSPYASCPSTISEDYNTSATYTVPESDVSSGNDRCVQFRVWMRTNDTDYTPAIDSVTIGYDIADRSQEQNTDQSWIALDYYFYEPDSDDNVTFSVTDTAGVNISEVNISIGTEVPYVVRVKAGESYTGTMQLLFHMDDGYNVTDSNVVELTIEEAATTPQVIILPVGGGGGAVSQPQPEEVPVYISTPVSFRLVVPQHVTTYMNDTMDIPINLFNSNFTMRNLRLKAVTSNPDVKLKLSQDYFDVMNPNEVKYINLRVESYKTYGTYELIVEAEADATAVAADGTESTSRFNERAKIFVNSLLKAEGNDTQVNTKLAFAEDLLSTNPECLELNEFLKKARQKLDAGEGFEADRMLEQVIESCKYLIAPRDRDALIEAPVTVYGMPTESVFILGAVALVTLIVAVALVVGWARMKAGKKEYIKR